MVRVVENRAAVEGMLTATVPDPDRPGFLRATVEVRAAAEVAGLPNLVKPWVGQTVVVLVREGHPLATAAPGPVRFNASLERPGLLMAREGP